MRRIVFLLLAILMLLTACGQTQPKKAENDSQTTKQKLVPMPTTWEMIDALPIASGDMTEAELRQLCVDFFRMQQSIQWTLKAPFAYRINTYDKYPDLKTETVYAGCPYVSPSIAGNIYRIMDFYDSETGVLDNTQMNSQDFAMLIGNDCVSGPFWGWARVVNSFQKYSNAYMTKEYGCFPVGTYTYDDSITYWSEEHSTKSICDQNGRTTMFESYACLQPADGIYTQWNTAANSHMRMISQAPTVVRNEYGLIDSVKSYVTYIDQGSSFEEYNWDGATVLVQGDVDVTVSFEDLYNNGYLPLTFAELIGEDPVEPATISLLNPVPENATIKDILEIYVVCNYAISHCTLELRDAEGNVTYQKTCYTQKIDLRETAISGLISIPKAETLLENGPQSLTITCRVSTGQLLTVYEGMLTA